MALQTPLATGARAEQSPAVPTPLAPVNGGLSDVTSAQLRVRVSDPDGDSLTVVFHGRLGGDAGPDFTLIGIPDTQYYAAQVAGGHAGIMRAQTQWIASQAAARNIAQVIHLGDCVERGDNGGNPIEWARADSAFRFLENPQTTGRPDGLPYGICVGNHDQSPIGDADGTTTFYNQYFGAARFAGRGYYGGHYGDNNDNWFELFHASGMDFIIVGLEYDTTPDAAVLAWADSLLGAHQGRRAIVASHWIIGTGVPGNFGAQGLAIYDRLKWHRNLFLLLCGHVPGEGRRQDTYAGRTVHTLLSNYQDRPHGGDGWLRIMEFSPVANVIRVRTYSPWLGQFETDADSSSQFTIPYVMTMPFEVLGTVTGVPSGGEATIEWSGLFSSSGYQWYATASDGSAVSTGPAWTFVTATPAAVPERVPGGLALGAVTPNPTGGGIAVRFDLPRAERVIVDVLDIRGRRVGRLADAEYGPGGHVVRWDGPRPAMEAGLYVVRVRAGGAKASRKFTVLR